MPGLKFRPEIPETLRKKSRGRLLKIIFLSGIILALLVLGALAALSLLRPGDSPPEDQGFFQTLRDYDRAPGGSSPEFLSRKLDKLEKEAQGVEAYLSVLKRRRALARTDPRFLPPYREAARRAAAAYPYSEPLAAIAAAALIRGQALTRAEELGQYLTVLSSGSFYPLRLSLHILRGDFKDPRTAAEIPSLSTVLGGALPRIRGQIPSGAAESLITCLTILKTLEGGAGAEEIRWGLSEALNPAASPDFLRFAAEYFYDYREPLKAAELFSRLDTEEDFSRQADALWLAEQPAAARNIWTLLAFPAGENSPPASSAAAARSLYNLALYAANPEEAAARYQQLLAPDPAGNGGPSAAAPESRIYGLIRYSRMVGTPLALAVLEEGIKSFPGNPLLDLELLKRRGEFQEPERLIAETWLLLGRHPGSEELSRWAAWYFDFQRRPGETALVLRNAARQGIAAPWTGLHEALGSIYAGNLSRAEDILRALPPEETGWEVFANRGRIYEALRAPAAALEYYETAAAEVQNRKEAARIQLHIARCLRALGRGREIRRVLEYALDLDPGNLKARLELDRLAPAGL